MHDKEDEKPVYWEPTPGEGGMTELQYAAYNGDLEGVLAALRNGDDINLQDQGGWAPLHWAADMGMANGEREEVFAALIQAGADLEVRDLEGSTPLLVACRSGNGDLVRQLVTAGANIQAANNKGWTALIEAACYGNPQTVTFLLDSGADITARTAKGETALEKARDYEWEEIVRILSTWQ
jgi:ankyrin repeat protein